MRPSKTQLVTEFSPEATAAVEWERASAELARAGIYWILTTRADGRPHVTPLIGVFEPGEGFYFCTGAQEQKYVNLEHDPHCAVLTGNNRYDGGLDVVIEGTARRIDDDEQLRTLAQRWVDKYGEEWRFEVEQGRFTHGDHGRATVFTVDADKALGFSRDDGGSQTRYTF